MLKSNSLNLTKKRISKEVQKNTGLSHKYSEEIIDDFILILKKMVKKNKVVVKNFGFFKVLNKKQRIGRNPKTKQEVTIKPRKSISFIVSRKMSI